VLSKLGLVPDLRQHFERSGLVTNRVDDNAIEVRRPDAPSEAQTRREIESHLTVWRAMHPEAEAELTP
jgi:hypothetical protein